MTVHKGLLLDLAAPLAEDGFGLGLAIVFLDCFSLGLPVFASALAFAAIRLERRNGWFDIMIVSMPE